MTRTHESAPSARDHPKVRLFATLRDAVDSGAARVDGDWEALRRRAAVFSLTAN